MSAFFENWFINNSEIRYGQSAILDDNYVLFYSVHSIAIALLLISLATSIIVIVYILTFSRKDGWDFPDRFPLYLAIANVLYGVSNLFGHGVLIATQRFPEAFLAECLSVNFFLFVGYEQLIHAGLAIYTYLKIGRKKSLNLGRGEWKLHLTCFALTASSIAIFYPLNSFGNAGYWFLADVKTTAGVILGFHICIFTTIHALCTSAGYWSIKRTVEAHKHAIVGYTRSSNNGRHSTAIECLTTYIHISLYLYCPLAVGGWAFMFLASYGIIEPFTTLCIIILANSRGWANALGYWYNKKIKDSSAKNPQFRNTRTITFDSTNT